MPQKHSKSQSRKNQFSRYKTSGHYAKNKKAKLEAHLKKFPDDEQAKEALKSIPSEPQRGTPKTRMWKGKKREVAEMYASAGINGHHALENGKISAAIDAEMLRFNSEHKESQMKKDKDNQIPTAKKKTPSKNKKKKSS